MLKKKIDYSILFLSLTLTLILLSSSIVSSVDIRAGSGQEDEGEEITGDGQAEDQQDQGEQEGEEQNDADSIEQGEEEQPVDEEQPLQEEGPLILCSEGLELNPETGECEEIQQQDSLEERPELCDNSIDDDLDGLVDLADSDCLAAETGLGSDNATEPEVIGSAVQTPGCTATLTSLVIGKFGRVGVIGGNPASGTIGVKVECTSPPGGEVLTREMPVDPITTTRPPLVPIQLSSSDTTVATVPQSRHFGFTAGEHKLDFTINTLAIPEDKRVRITASYEGQTKQATLTVRPSPIHVEFLSIGNSQIIPGDTLSIPIIVRLNAPAIDDGTVALTSDRPDVLPVDRGQEITIPAGGTSGHDFYTTNPVSEDTPVTITATWGQTLPKQASVTVVP